jgi:hypothetical protein
MIKNNKTTKQRSYWLQDYLLKAHLSDMQTGMDRTKCRNFSRLPDYGVIELQYTCLLPCELGAAEHTPSKFMVNITLVSHQCDRLNNCYFLYCSIPPFYSQENIKFFKVEFWSVSLSLRQAGWTVRTLTLHHHNNKNSSSITFTLALQGLRKMET